MNWNDEYRRALRAVLVVPLIGLGGCIEYTVEATLEADGSGNRVERMVVADADDTDFVVSSEDFLQLMHVTENDGWTHSVEMDEEDTVDVFRRETQVRNLASWTETSGDIHIAGATIANSGSSIRHFRLGDVHFRNSVMVESGQGPEGRTFTYRETFYWDKLLDALVEGFLVSFESMLDRDYPDLSSGERGELTGLVRGGLWALVDQGVLDADSDREDELISAYVDRTTRQGMPILRQRYPDAEAHTFATLLEELYDDQDDQLDTFIEEKLPGVQLAGNTEIIFRLNMPGRISDENADDRDGATLVWKFSPWDAVQTPVEVFAQSVVER